MTPASPQTAGPRPLARLLRNCLPAAVAACAPFLAFDTAEANGNVFVSRFWHNHQPIYWPEWNSNGSQNQRVQYAWDSIVLKPTQNYGGLSPSRHPENNLTDIFGLDDRRNAYQSGPRNSLANLNSAAGFALSYSGSLIDNIRQLGGLNQLGYGSSWWNGNREARNWRTPSGSRRLDLVGFTYHHSLAPLLPKSVLRKEIQTFKQAYWKAWGGNSDLSDHSKGFFPTEMGYSRHIIDVLVDEGYEWVIVASHHISRTSPSYNTRANPEGTYNIFSNPPNRADQLGPEFSTGWWYSEPNPGNAAWNVSPFAYQLHRVKYVNPETGAEKKMIAVPSDDVLSYRYGYANEGVGKIDTFIAPFANSPSRPVIVMPSTDGDNAWGGGSSSWFEATPQLFNDSGARGYRQSTPQDFVNAHGAAATDLHIEDGAWIFPEMDYGSPQFLKWIEPPVANAAIGATNRYPGTQIDMETPGFALKFYSYAPLMAGANWVETAEQILRDEGGSVQAWKIQAPYDWDGTWTSPNDVELAWHIYLKGLDSGFNYYGGLGNDDEMKPGLATRRAVEKLQPWMTQTRRNNDRTPPTVLKPQRFPYNPGWFTFGWFNSVPGGDTRFLKKMPSWFYIWTHAYDLSGVSSVTAKVRVDNDGVNPLGSNQNETYAGGSEVGTWVSIPMTKRVLPNTRAALNAAAANSQIDYFLPTNEQADYYFAKIDDASLPGFKGKLLDYYVEAVDSRGNVHKSDIQHVFVVDDGQSGPVVPAAPTGLTATAASSSQINLSWTASAGATGYKVFRGGTEIASPSGTTYSDTGLAAGTLYTYTVVAVNTAGNSPASNQASATTTGTPTPPATPTGLTATAVSSTQINLSWNAVPGATSYQVLRGGTLVGSPSGTTFNNTGLTPLTTYSYTVRAVNAAGNSAESSAASATTPAQPIVLPDFALNGTSVPGYSVSAAGGMNLHAAIRGTKLYVATWSPGNSGGLNDHFIIVSDSLLPSATTTNVWAKAGTMAVPAASAFIGAESAGTYAGWFNAPAGARIFKAATNAGQVQGEIDLVEKFGAVPPTLYIAAVAFATADGGALAAQTPAGNGNNILEPGEFLAIPTAALRDSTAAGTLDVLNPARGFNTAASRPSGSQVTLEWPTLPGRTYQVLYKNDLSDPTWLNTLPGSSITAGAAQFSATYTDNVGAGVRRFYMIRLQP